VDFDADAAYKNIHAVRPGIEVLTVSAKGGEGMSAWLNLLESRQRGANPSRKSDAPRQSTWA
jgi:Ni2+-binding GTPase involved in maturation of urease and hydrogenase